VLGILLRRRFDAATPLWTAVPKDVFCSLIIRCCFDLGPRRRISTWSPFLTLPHEHRLSEAHPGRSPLFFLFLGIFSGSWCPPRFSLEKRRDAASSALPWGLSTFFLLWARTKTPFWADFKTPLSFYRSSLAGAPLSRRQYPNVFPSS